VDEEVFQAVTLHDLASVAIWFFKKSECKRGEQRVSGSRWGSWDSNSEESLVTFRQPNRCLVKLKPSPPPWLIEVE